MDEKPKSIWKKSWKGWRCFRPWLILVAATFLILLILTQVLPHGPQTYSDWLTALLVFSVASVIAATIFLGLWQFARWLFGRRNIKRTLFGCACLATLIALFYAEEDWRGKHDWEKFKRQWEAKGERFDWQSIIPPPVPDDENFAFSPVWIAEIRYGYIGEERTKAWYGDRIYGEEVAKIETLLPVSTTDWTGTNWITVHNLPNSPQESYYGWTTAQAMDLKPWQAYYRELEKVYPAADIPVTPKPQTPAQDVLLALSKFNPVIEQLRQDSARPDSRFPIQYDTDNPAAILLPHLAPEKQFALVLQLRAVAELQNGESEKALDDVKLMLRLTDVSRSEPFLISHLVRLAMLQITLQPIYEGLAEHKWSDAQLAKLDSELAKMDFLADYKFAVRGERTLEIADIEFLRHPPHNPPFRRPRLYFLAPFFSLVHMLSILSGPDGDSHTGFQMLALGLGPSGWLNQNELCIAQFETKWYLPVVDEGTETISPAKVHAAYNTFDREIRHRTPENVLETLLMPSLGGVAKRFAYAQSSVDLARTAIALERCYLVYGEYPKSLDVLTPKFLEKIPHDIINGQPLHYRQTSDGQFVLYSVGWNQMDDGGVVGLKKDGVVDWDTGDWVWRYPSK